MAVIPPHPNEDGAWTRLESSEGLALWQRERNTFAPVTMYYLVQPPQQTEILYDPEKARDRYEAVLTRRTAAG